MSSQPDLLFDLKNSLYLGNWQQCLNEAQKIKTNNEDQILERDVFMYRAYIGQKKFAVVMSEIKSTSPLALKTVRLLAQYQSQPNDRLKIVDELNSNLESYRSDNLSSVCVASVFYLDKNYESVLKLLYNADDIECMALSIQTFLKLDRIDLARKELKRICQKDEYHTLSQLAQAWIHIYQSGEKLQDAYFIYQELKEKFGPTPLLLNGQATVLICQNRLEEAESLIQEAIGKDPNNTEAIINQLVLAELLGKSTEVVNRYINQLSDPSLDQTFISDYQAKQTEFDKIALQYKC